MPQNKKTSKLKIKKFPKKKSYHSGGLAIIIAAKPKSKKLKSKK